MRPVPLMHLRTRRRARPGRSSKAASIVWNSGTNRGILNWLCRKLEVRSGACRLRRTAILIARKTEDDCGDRRAANREAGRRFRRFHDRHARRQAVEGAKVVAGGIGHAEVDQGTGEGRSGNRLSWAPPSRPDEHGAILVQLRSVWHTGHDCRRQRFCRQRDCASRSPVGKASRPGITASGAGHAVRGWPFGRSRSCRHRQAREPRGGGNCRRLRPDAGRGPRGGASGGRCSPVEAAARLGCSINTAISHLRAVFNRTGFNRQADVISAVRNHPVLGLTSMKECLLQASRSCLPVGRVRATRLSSQQQSTSHGVRSSAGTTL